MKESLKHIQIVHAAFSGMEKVSGSFFPAKDTPLKIE